MGLIYLDSCVVIYLTEHHPVWGKAVSEAIAKQAEGRFGLSPLVKCECLVGAFKRNDPVLEHAYRGIFERFLSFDMPEEVYLRAARHRALAGMRTPDALHLACAQYHGCDALWTNDDRLTRTSHGLAIDVSRIASG